MAEMKAKGNVLVVGNSGVGKSTLINAVLGDNYAVTSYGTAGTTSEVKVYEQEASPFNLVDTVGFEPDFIKENAAISDIRKWSQRNVKDGIEENDVNVIWFCIDGMASKLFPRTLKNFARATKVWRSAPIIIVITKSFSGPDRDLNIQMVKAAVSKDKYLSEQLRAIVPVVAKVLTVSDSAFVPPSGIAELIEETEKAMPEGRAAAKKDVEAFIFGRKRAMAQGAIAASTVAAAAVGFAPIPLADAAILVPIEGLLIKTLAKLYNIEDNDKTRKIASTIVEAGTVSLVAKAAISALKSIPAINLAAAPLNAAVAASIVAAVGESTSLAFEQIHRGEKDLDDPSWIRELVEKALSEQFVAKVAEVLKVIAENNNAQENAKDIAKIVFEAASAMMLEKPRLSNGEEAAS